MFKVPEKYRIKSGFFKSTKKDGNNGAFIVPFSQRSMACIIASDGEGWEHVSVHMKTYGKERTPTWAEMCKIKGLFWGAEDCVVQYHPPKSEYVNNHKHVLHLWRQVGKEFDLPDSLLVGVKSNVISG